MHSRLMLGVAIHRIDNLVGYAILGNDAAPAYNDFDGQW